MVNQQSDPDFPDDFDAGDAQFSSISWSADLDETFAIAPADVDPRTGEILRAKIVFTHGWLNYWTTSYRFLRDGKVPGKHLPSVTKQSGGGRSRHRSLTERYTLVSTGFRIYPRPNSKVSFQRVIAQEHLSWISPMGAAFARQSYESVEDLVLDGVTAVTMHEVKCARKSRTPRMADCALTVFAFPLFRLVIHLVCAITCEGALTTTGRT